jgi:hypothetical protein
MRQSPPATAGGEGGPPHCGQALGQGVVEPAIAGQAKGEVLEPPQLAHRHPQLVRHPLLATVPLTINRLLEVEVRQGAGHSLQRRRHPRSHLLHPTPPALEHHLELGQGGQPP